jgi:hypothetical protein
MTSRRNVLALLAAAPFTAQACASNTPDPVAGWRDPGAGETDPRRFALAHAILAPSPHNTQPWQVALDGDDAMTLYCDLDRRLDFTDPYDRQITVGCGCFTELYRLALTSLGYAPEITPFPDGAPEGRLDGRALVRVALGDRGAQTDALFAQITARHTNRELYDAARAPSDDALATIATSALPLDAAFASEPSRVAQLRDLVWRGFDRELRTRGAQEETYKWLRFGREQVATHRDGLAIEGPMIPVLRTLGFFDREDFLNPNSTANQSAARDWRRKAETAPAFMWLITPDDAPLTRLHAGVAYARMNLAATGAGVAMHPWSQVLQEYQEMADLYAETKAHFGVTGTEAMQMLVRVGYADPVEPSARRDLAEIIRA